MKILLVNGSPHPAGATAASLSRIASVLEGEGASAETVHLGASPMPDCAACLACRERGECIYGDTVCSFARSAAAADGFVFASPVYYAHPTGRLLSFMNRLFFSSLATLKHKPAAAVFTSRRAGAVCALDSVNHHFLMAEMPVVSSVYWNQVFSADGKIEKDAEGLAVLDALAKNMVWLIRSIEYGRRSGLIPPENPRIKTGFLS